MRLRESIGKRWQALSMLFVQPWKKNITFLIALVSLYDLFVSQFVISSIQDDYPNVAEIMSLVSVSWYWWVIIFLSVTIIFMFEGAYRLFRFQDIAQILTKLVVYRENGVKLWHEGKSLLSEKSVEAWWNRHLEWKEECAQIIEEVDQSLAGDMRILGTGQGFEWKRGISGNHNHKVWMQSAWNNRLDEIIEKLRERQVK